jgi:hypothetical protein
MMSRKIWESSYMVLDSLYLLDAGQLRDVYRYCVDYINTNHHCYCAVVQDIILGN